MKLYISGPMTIKKDDCYNYEEFFYWSRVFKKRGYKVVNPARLDCERMFKGWIYFKWMYHLVLSHDCRLIDKQCDAIFMLRGWEKSVGALKEHGVAMRKGIPIWYEEDE